MPRTIYCLISILASSILVGCDGTDLQTMARAINAPNNPDQVANATCLAEAEFQRRATIAIRGTEILVDKVGIMSQGEMDASKSELENVAQAPLSDMKRIATAGGIQLDCATLGRTIAGMSQEITRGIHP